MMEALSGSSVTRLLCNTTHHVFDVSDERVGGEFAFKRQPGSETDPDCRQILEGHMMADHVHMLMSIPPKYAVSQVVGFIKGKSAIHLARVYAERKRSFVRQHFWARGYFVSTVGRDEAVIREYIKHQEEEDMRLD